MRIEENGHVAPTEDDVWAILVREVGSQRVTVVGPYWGIGGLKRASQDAIAWKDRSDVRTLVCRMMEPADMEEAIESADEALLFGYSANMRKRFEGLLTDEEGPLQQP